MTGDVKNAYVKAFLQGDPVFAEPPPQKKDHRFSCGVMQITMALYGLRPG